MPESEARAACRERQQEREREAATSSRQSHVIDPDDQLLAAVLRRSLTTVKTDAWRLRSKNAKVLRPAIEQSEREVAEKVVAKAKAARQAKEQARTVCWMAGIISFDDDSNVCDGSDVSDDAHPTAAAYTLGYSHTGDRKGKGPARKWLCPTRPLRFVYVSSSFLVTNFIFWSVCTKFAMSGDELCVSSCMSDDLRSCYMLIWL